MFMIQELSNCRIEPIHNNRGSVIKLIDRDVGSRKLDVHINILWPEGPEGIYHYHKSKENIYWILDGEGRAVIENEEYILKKNNIVFISPKTSHSLSNVGKKELKLLEIFAPSMVDFVPVDTDK